LRLFESRKIARDSTSQAVQEFQIDGLSRSTPSYETRVDNLNGSLFDVGLKTREQQTKVRATCAYKHPDPRHVREALRSRRRTFYLQPDYSA
jgi:hypothetical protein